MRYRCVDRRWRIGLLSLCLTPLGNAVAAPLQTSSRQAFEAQIDALRVEADRPTRVTAATDDEAQIARLLDEARDLSDEADRHMIRQRAADEVAVRRRAMAVWEKLRALQDASGAVKPSFAEDLRFRKARARLGDALYRVGALTDAEPMFAALAEETSRRLKKAYPTGQSDYDPIHDDDLLRYQTLAGNEAALAATIVRLQTLAAADATGLARSVMANTRADSLLLRAEGLMLAGRLPESVAAFERALEVVRTAPKPSATASRDAINRFANAYQARGFVLSSAGDRNGAWAAFQGAHAVLSSRLPANDPAVEVAGYRLAAADRLRRNDTAATIFDATMVLPSFTDALRGEDLDTFSKLLSSVGTTSTTTDTDVYGRVGMYRMMDRLLGKDHPTSIQDLIMLAAALHYRGRHAAALVLQSQAVERLDRLLGRENAEVARQRGLLDLYRRSLPNAVAKLPTIADFDAEMESLQNEVDAKGALGARGNGAPKETGAVIAEMNAQAEKLAESLGDLERDYRRGEEIATARRIVALRERMQELRASVKPDDTDADDNAADTRSAYAKLGEALYRDGQVTEAEPIFVRIAAEQRRDMAEGDAQRIRMSFGSGEQVLIRYLVLAGDADAAAAVAARYEATLPPADRTEKNAAWSLVQQSLTRALVSRGEGLMRANQPDVAGAAFERALTIGSRVWGPKATETRVLFNRYGSALEDRGYDLEKAGDREGAWTAFSAEAALTAKYFGDDALAVRVAGDRVRAADMLRRGDVHTTIDNAQRVFVPFTRYVRDDDRSALMAIDGFPDLENERSDDEVLDSFRKYDIFRRNLGDAHPATVQALAQLGYDLYSDERHEAAIIVQQKVVEQYDALFGARNHAALDQRGTLGRFLASANRFAEAEVHLRLAVAKVPTRPGTASDDDVSSWSNLHNALTAQAKYADALPYARAMLADAQVRSDALENDEMMSWRLRDVAAMTLADDLRQLGHYREAEASDRMAFDYRMRKLGAKDLNTRIAGGRLAVDLLPQQGREREAFTLAREAFDAFSVNTRQAWSRHESAASQEFQESKRLTSQPRDAYLEASWKLQRAGDAAAKDAGFLDGMYEALQDSFNSTASLAVSHAAGRRYAASVDATALVAKREALSERLAEAIKAAQAAESPRNTDRERGVASDSMEAIAREFTGLDRELAAKAPQYLAIVSQPPATLAETRMLLREDEALLIVAPTPTGTDVAAITRDGMTWHRADIRLDAVDAAVTRLRASLDPAEASRGLTIDNGGAAGRTGLPTFDRDTAYRLYDALIAPVAAGLTGKTHVFVATTGKLSSLPPAVLVTAPAQPVGPDGEAAALRRTRWFGDDHALIQIPSPQAFGYLRRFAKAGAPSEARSLRAGGPTYLGFGDPALDGSAQTRGGPSVAIPVAARSAVPATVAATMDPALLRGLARLPGTRVELAAMQTLVGASASRLFLAGEMTEAAIRAADLGALRVLHIATHGLTASQSGARGEPGLVFTPPATPTETDDGYLTASEVVGLRLNGVDWVILSACNTAAPSGEAGEASLSGLARAFLYAGAGGLLVSHWPVYDDVAAMLTVDTLRRAQAGGISRAEALRSAAQAIRNDAAHPRFAHPAAWAPFTVVGDVR